MSSIITIASGDLISTSRTDINTNFSNLNTDKIETSVLDTDTTLAANSDAKVATQKAVKAYVLANVNPTGASWNEYAADAGSTDAYVISLTGVSAYATGQTFKFKANTANTGACTLKVNSLSAITIKKDVTTDLATGDILANQDVVVIYDGTNMQMVSQRSGLAEDTDVTALTAAKQYIVGALDNALVKTYFNIQLLFILWTGSTSGALTTDFTNWIRNSTDVTVAPGGAYSTFGGTGADSIYVKGAFPNASFGNTNIIVLDWWAKLPATSTGDINMGFGGTSAGDDADFISIYNEDGAGPSGGAKVMFCMQGSTGTIYSTILKRAAGTSQTNISSGITNTNWNNFRIELDNSNNALFYINGVLKDTLSGANLPTSQTISIGFGRSNTAAFEVTAPNLSLQMNP